MPVGHDVAVASKVPRRAPAGGNALAGLAWRRLALVGLAGVSVRMTVLAVPPLLPRIREDLGLNETSLAALTTLPVLLLALAAPLGSALVSRAGPRGALVWGLAGIAVFGALRGAGADVWSLFAWTFLMGIAVATVQPALPALVQRWLPRAAGPATSSYTLGMIGGEALAAGLTLPVVLPLTGSWPAALAVWSLPAVLTAGVLGAVREPDAVPARAARVSWWPDWRSGRTWRLGSLQGAGSTLYFAVNAFLPTYLRTVGAPHLVGLSLTVLNVAQLPAPLVLAALPTRWSTSRTSTSVLGVLGLGGLVLILTGDGGALLAGAGLVGLAAAGCLTVAYTLPAVLADPGDAHRVSAGMFTIGYALAFLLPLAGGALWDSTGTPALAFAPAFAAGAGVIAVGALLRRRRD